MATAAPIDNPYRTLVRLWPDSVWLESACHRAWQHLQTHRHGDLPRWWAALAALPPALAAADLDRPAPRLGQPIGDSPGVRSGLREVLKALHPWRKGPLCLGGQTIDSEWRSDWKWARIAPRVDLRDARVLDVGCGNGYYGWRMLGAGARLVVGVDPTLVYVMQWLACRNFAGDLPNYVLPLGLEDLPAGDPSFDAVFSMGVLYHRRDPVRHLQRLRTLVRPGGLLVLESLVLPEDRSTDLLVPENRYARMRNVWAIPGSRRLLDWLGQAEWSGMELLDVSRTTTEEQRSTRWMQFDSLEQALDPADTRRTIEGHPAPIRALLTARR